MARAVTVIPQSIHPFTKAAINSATKRKVAAYARVSTDSEEQLTSYEAQVDYYTRYINSKPEWEFVKVYTDEGITAGHANKRVYRVITLRNWAKFCKGYVGLLRFYYE